jgi:hypothetical protein
MKGNGFLLLRATSKVQNVVAIVSCVQKLEANLHKHQATKPKAQTHSAKHKNIKLQAKLRRKHGE